METKGLNIWLIGEGEGLPIQENAHLMRMGTIANYLSGQGHKVLWWSSSYLHGEKRYITQNIQKYDINKNYRLILLHSRISYKRNISLKRIIYHKILASQFERYSKNKNKPDIILCAWPTPQFAKAAVRYGKNNNVPVIIDARDMWPDIFVRAFPAKLEGLAEIALLPLKKSCARTFKGAYGITAMIDAVLKWACKYAGRQPGKRDKTVYIGNKRLDLSDEKFTSLSARWKEMGISNETWNICFFSTFGSHIAIDTVIKAVKELSISNSDIHLLIGGGGDREEYFKAISDGCKNVHFLGWLNNEEMTSLMRISRCGAFSIKNTFDFKDTFNTKAIQYISEGLPILNSLSGFAKTLIAEEDMGVSYECDNVADCKEKIMQLYNDENKRKVMGQNAQNCYFNKFESGIVNKQMEDYLLSMQKMYCRQE